MANPFLSFVICFEIVCNLLWGLFLVYNRDRFSAEVSKTSGFYSIALGLLLLTGAYFQIPYCVLGYLVLNVFGLVLNLLVLVFGHDSSENVVSTVVLFYALMFAASMQYCVYRYYIEMSAKSQV